MRKEPQQLWIVPLIVTLIATFFIILTSLASPKIGDVKMEDILAELPLVIVVFGWVILVQQVKNDPKIFNPLLGGSVLMFFGFLEDVLDEIYDIPSYLFGMRVESFIALGLLLCMIGLWFWIKEHKQRSFAELTSKNLKSIAQQLQKKNEELAKKNKEVESIQKKLKKANDQLSKRNAQLDAELENLYSLRTTLEKGMSQSVKKANKQVLWRIKKLKE